VAPNYGHLTINWGDEPLVFEAFLSSNLTPITEPYRTRRGGAHYVVKGSAQPEIVMNESYAELPMLRRCHGNNLESWEAKWGDLCYRWVVEHPEDFLFLVDPTRFDSAWTV
jgi:hypothetical protein